MAEVKARIMSASKARGPLKICVYGRNKVGKTQFAGSSDLKTIVVDCRDRGTETLADRPNVDVYQVEEAEDIDAIFWFLKTQKHDYEVIVIDNVTMFATIAMKKVLGPRARELMSAVIPAQNHWNSVTQMLENLILEWRDLPYHIVFLAQERTETINSEDGLTLVDFSGPALSPAAQKVLMAAVGTIAYAYTKEVEKDGKMVTQYRMRFAPHARYIVGTRIRGLPKVMINPTLKRVLAIRDQAGENPVTHPVEASTGE